jgi:hypothetical protein
MKNIVRAALLILFLASMPVWAESVVFNYPLSPETMGAFNQTTERLAEHPIVRGSFAQEKILGGLGRSLKSSGNFIISSELGMVWDTLEPYPSTLALGKDYLVQSRPGGRKTVISAQGNETFIRLAEVISAVFSGNTRRLMENFDVYYTGGVSGWELGLLPKDKAITSFAERIAITGNSAINSIYINEQNGGAISYILSNHSYPPELALHEKSLFALP